MDLKIAGKHALVLGATRGIGFSSAKLLAEEGCYVTLCGRSADGVAQACEKMPGAGHSGFVIDLSDKPSVDRLISSIEKGEIKVDILVNNSGGPPLKRVCETTVEEWEYNARAMVYPIFEITRAVVTKMTEGGWGRIITIVSSGVLQPIAGLGISNALRSSIVGWSKTLSNEVAPSGITVNCVVPGRIRTERVQQVDEARARSLGVDVDNVRRQSFESIPMGRYGEPHEIASAICFLASQASSYITGSLIRVDGGAIRSV